MSVSIFVGHEIGKYYIQKILFRLDRYSVRMLPAFRRRFTPAPKRCWIAGGYSFPNFGKNVNGGSPSFRRGQRHTFLFFLICVVHIKCNENLFIFNHITFMFIMFILFINYHRKRRHLHAISIKRFKPGPAEKLHINKSMDPAQS